MKFIDDMNLEKLEKVMEKGFDLNIIALLHVAKNGENLKSELPKIQAIIQMMERKELILEGRITQKGEEVLKYAEGEGEIVKEQEKVNSLEDVYNRVQNRIFELTGKKQIRTEIFGKTYSYFPSKYDFVNRLKKVINKYKLSDLEKVEKVILRNIESCHKKNKWYPLLVYYMVKDEISPLSSDYFNWEDIKDEGVKEIKSNDTII